MNCLDFDSFIYKIAIQNRKEKKKWNIYHVPGIVRRGKDTAKRKVLTLQSLHYHGEDSNKQNINI